MMTEPNDIDLLMSKDPLEMSKLDLDTIIAYNRNQRALREAGGRKSRKDSSSPPLDLEKLGLKIAKPKVERRM